MHRIIYRSLGTEVKKEKETVEAYSVLDHLVDGSPCSPGLDDELLVGFVVGLFLIGHCGSYAPLPGVRLNGVF